MFGRYRKGEAPSDFGAKAYASFDEAPLDRFPDGSDGDNAELLDQFEHLVSDDQIAALEKEVPS